MNIVLLLLLRLLMLMLMLMLMHLLLMMMVIILVEHAEEMSFRFVVCDEELSYSSRRIVTSGHGLLDYRYSQLRAMAPNMRQWPNLWSRRTRSTHTLNGVVEISKNNIAIKTC